MTLSIHSATRLQSGLLDLNIHLSNVHIFPIKYVAYFLQYKIWRDIFRIFFPLIPNTIFYNLLLGNLKMLSFIPVQNNLWMLERWHPLLTRNFLCTFIQRRWTQRWCDLQSTVRHPALHNPFFSFPNRLREGAAGQFLLQAASSVDLRLRSVCLELAKVIPVTTPEGEVTPTWDWTGHSLFLGQLRSLLPLQKYLGGCYFTQPWSDNSVCQSPWAHPSRQSLQSLRTSTIFHWTSGKKNTKGDSECSKVMRAQMIERSRSLLIFTAY